MFAEFVLNVMKYYAFRYIFKSYYLNINRCVSNVIDDFKMGLLMHAISIAHLS